MRGGGAAGWRGGVGGGNYKGGVRGPFLVYVSGMDRGVGLGDEGSEGST